MFRNHIFNIYVIKSFNGCGFILIYRSHLYREGTVVPRSNYLTVEPEDSYARTTVVSILLYGWTTWTIIKHMEKKLDGNYTRMLQTILNKSWRQHPAKQQLYSHLPTITKTIQVRWTRLAEHCWRSGVEHISDILLWTPSHGWAKSGRHEWTYIQQLCGDKGYTLENLSKVMDDRDGWRERVREIHAVGVTRWHDHLQYLICHNPPPKKKIVERIICTGEK